MEPIAHLRLVEKSEPPEYDEQTLKAHNENSGKSVSYTHLTLPTSDLV